MQYIDKACENVSQKICEKSQLLNFQRDGSLATLDECRWLEDILSNHCIRFSCLVPNTNELVNFPPSSMAGRATCRTAGGQMSRDTCPHASRHCYTPLKPV